MSTGAGFLPVPFWLKAMIKIKHIVAFEQLTGKSFFALDDSNEDDVMAFAFIISEQRCEFKYFKSLSKTNNKWLKKAVEEINHDLRYINQFSHEKERESEENEEKPMIGDIIGALITDGVDARWLMDSGMEVLGWVWKAHIEKEKQLNMRLRHWVKILLTPNLTKEGRKMSEKEFMPFAWEEEVKEKEDVTDKDLKIAKALFGH